MRNDHVTGKSGADPRWLFLTEEIMFRVSLALFFPVFLCLPTQTSVGQDKPNFVLVFMDNFGWGEPGFNGGGIIRGAPTPRLDKLASEGELASEMQRQQGCQ